MVKKLVSLLTTGCFLFSFVLADALHASVDNARDGQRFKAIADEFLLPASTARITDGSDCGSRTVVVNIQDLHCHPEVQRNISRILSLLDRKYRLKKIYVEGAAGAVDTSWLGGIQDGKLRKELVEGLLAQGKLTGTEHFSVTAGRPDVLEGLEQEQVYRANLQRFDRLLAKKEVFDSLLLLLRKDLAGLKETYFNAENRKLEGLIERHRGGGIETAKYYRLLWKYAETLNRRNGASAIAPAKYPVLAAYLDLLDQGKDRRSSRITRELQQFIALLKQKLPYQAYNYLIERTDGFSQAGELYALLPRLAKEYGLPLSAYPALEAFLGQVEKSRQLNPLALLRDEKRLTGDIRNALSEDVAELEVSFLAGFFDYLDDYLHLRLAADDYDHFRDRFGEFRALWAKYAETDRLKEFPAELALLDEYYRVNLERNTLFLSNLLRTVRAAKGDPSAPRPVTDSAAALACLDRAQEVVVVVTGGFHTEGLKALLVRRGLTCLTITPNVTQDTKHSDEAYQTLARQQARILSQMLAPMLVSALVGIIGRSEGPEKARAVSAVCQYVLEAEAARAGDLSTEQDAVRATLNEIFKGKLEIRECRIVRDGGTFRAVVSAAGGETMVFEVSGKGTALSVRRIDEAPALPAAEREIVRGVTAQQAFRRLAGLGLSRLEATLLWHLWLAAPGSLSAPSRLAGRADPAEELAYALGREVFGGRAPGNAAAGGFIGAYELLSAPVLDEQDRVVRFTGRHVKTGREDEIEIEVMDMELPAPVLEYLSSVDNGAISRIADWYRENFNGKVLLLADNPYNIFALGTKDILGLHFELHDNVVAIFHEMAEAMSASGALSADEIVRELSDEGRAWYGKMTQDAPPSLRLHYAVRALQREFFGDGDQYLSDIIKLNVKLSNNEVLALLKEAGVRRNLAVLYRFLSWRNRNVNADIDQEKARLRELVEEQKAVEGSEDAEGRSLWLTTSRTRTAAQQQELERIGALLEEVRRGIDPKATDNDGVTQRLLGELTSGARAEITAEALVKFLLINKDMRGDLQGKALDALLTSSVIPRLGDDIIAAVLAKLLTRTFNEVTLEKADHALSVHGRIVTALNRPLGEAQLRQLAALLDKHTHREYAERVSVREFDLRGLPRAAMAYFTADPNDPDNYFFNKDFLKDIIWLRDMDLIKKLRRLYLDARFGQDAALEAYQLLMARDEHGILISSLLNALERDALSEDEKAAVIILLTSRVVSGDIVSIEREFLRIVFEACERTTRTDLRNDYQAALAALAKSYISKESKEDIAVFVIRQMNARAAAVATAKRGAEEADRAYREAVDAEGKDSVPAKIALSQRSMFLQQQDELMKEMERDVRTLAFLVMHSLPVNKERGFAVELLQYLLKAAWSDTWGRDTSAEIISRLTPLVPSGNDMMVATEFTEKLVADPALRQKLLDTLVHEQDRAKVLPLLRWLAQNAPDNRAAYLLIVSFRNDTALLKEIIGDAQLDIRWRMHAFACAAEALAADVERQKVSPETDIRQTGLFPLIQSLEGEALAFLKGRAADGSWAAPLVDDILLQDEETKAYVTAVFVTLCAAVPGITLNDFQGASESVAITRLAPYWGNAESRIVLGGRLIKRSPKLSLAVIAHELGHALFKGRKVSLPRQLKFDVLDETLADSYAFILCGLLGIDYREFMDDLDYHAEFENVAADRFHTVESHEGARALLQLIVDKHNELLGGLPDWHRLLSAITGAATDPANRDLLLQQIVADTLERYAGKKLPANVAQAIPVIADDGSAYRRTTIPYDIDDNEIKTPVVSPDTVEGVLRSVAQALKAGLATFGIPLGGAEDGLDPASALWRLDPGNAGGLIGRLFDAAGRLVTEGITAEPRDGRIYFTKNGRPLFTAARRPAWVQPAASPAPAVDLDLALIGREEPGLARYIQRSAPQAALIEDNGAVRGFSDGSALYVGRSLARDPVARLHELGEGYFAQNPEELPDGVSAHTWLRGCGKDVRRLAQRYPERFVRPAGMKPWQFVDGLERFLKAQLGAARFNDSEIALIYHNAIRGYKGRELLYGLQDRVFGEAGNTLGAAPAAAAPEEGPFTYEYREISVRNGASLIPRLFVNGSEAEYLATGYNSFIFAHPQNPGWRIHVEKNRDSRFFHRFNMAAGPRGLRDMAGWQGAGGIEVPAGPVLVDFGEMKGRRFVVTAAVEGETLDDLIEKRKREPEAFPGRTFTADFHEVLSLLERLVLSGILVKNFNPDNIILGHRPYAKLDRAYIVDASGAERRPVSLELIQAYQAQLRDWGAAGTARLMLSDYLDTLLHSPEWKAAMGGRQGRRTGDIFYGSYEQGRIEEPASLRDRLHNLRYALGEPFFAAPAWETVAFPLLGLTALPALLVAAGFAPLAALGAGVLYVTAGFALAHPASPARKLRDFLARSALSFLLSAPFLAPAAAAAFAGTSLGALASAAPFAAAAYLAAATAAVAFAHSRYNRAVLTGRVPPWLRGLVLSVFGQDGRGLRYVGKTDDTYRYPIYLLPDGRKVIRKYAGSMSHLDFALNARAAYVTAQRLGFPGINEVSLDFDEPGSVSSLEEFYGVSLDESRTLDRGIVKDLLGELTWGDATQEVYPRLVSRFGPSFVEGDIYRIFSNFFGDSGTPNNIRVSDETGELRWIDYNLSFFPQQSYDQRDARAYVQAHAPYFLAHGRRLVEAVAGLDDAAVEALAEEVYGGETRERLVRKFIAEQGLTEALARQKADGMLEGLREVFLVEIKWRRSLFREILPGPAAAPAVREGTAAAPVRTYQPLFPAKTKGPAVKQVQGLALKAGVLGAAGVAAALTDASAKLFGAGRALSALSGGTVYWLPGADGLFPALGAVSGIRGAAGVNGIVVSNGFFERGGPKADDRIWLGRVLVPAGANDYEAVGVWAAVEGEQRFDRAGRLAAIQDPVVVTYFERNTKSRVRSEDLDRTGRLKVISLIAGNKVARRNLAGLYGRWRIATAGRAADEILAPAALVSEDPRILDGIRGDDLVDLKGAAKGRKWDMLNTVAVVGADEVAGESAVRALGVIAAAVRDREAQGFQKGYELIVRLATGGRLLEASDAGKLARLMKVMRGGSVRLDELPLAGARPEEEARVRQMISSLRAAELKVHFSLAARPGQSLEELGDAASAWLAGRDGAPGFNGVELDLSGLAGLESGTLAAWLNAIGRAHPEALITVVLPGDRQGDRERIRSALGENVSVASEVTIDETRRGDPAEIAGGANGCVKLRLKDFDGRLEDYIRTVNAGIVEVWLGDLAGIEPGEQEGRGKGILGLLDGLAEETFADNAGALAALLSANPESVYRSALKYEGADLPDGRTADAIARLLAGRGLGDYAAGRRGSGELQAGVRALGDRAGEFIAEAQQIDVGGAVRKRLDVLAEKARAGAAADTENLAAFLAGIAERALAKEHRERTRKAGFAEDWQEKEFGRALLAGAAALNDRKAEGAAPEEKAAYVWLGLMLGKFDRAEADEALKALRPGPGDGRALVRYLELVSAYRARVGGAADLEALVPDELVQAAQRAGGRDEQYGAAAALLRVLGKTVPAAPAGRAPGREEALRRIDAETDLAALRRYVTSLQESGIVAADYLALANRAAVRAKELSADRGPLAVSEYLRILDLLSDLKETAGVQDEMKKILNTQGMYAILGAA